MWSDILKGREVLHHGLIHRIGNGNDTSLWFHKWVGEEELINVSYVETDSRKVGILES